MKNISVLKASLTNHHKNIIVKGIEPITSMKTKTIARLLGEAVIYIILWAVIVGSFLNISF